jgi:hypothetical protein
MSWQSEMTTIVRVLIGDTEPPETYSDARLQQLIVVAAQCVVAEVNFPVDYDIDVEAITIAPDPTDDPRDDSFINLVSMKSVCLLFGSELRVASGQAFSVRDGNSSMNLGPIFDSKSATTQDFCKAYQDSKWEYQSSTAAIAGKAILGPFSSDIIHFHPIYRSY